jgi:hypothetical protein
MFLPSPSKSPVRTPRYVLSIVYGTCSKLLIGSGERCTGRMGHHDVLHVCCYRGPIYTIGSDMFCPWVIIFCYHTFRKKVHYVFQNMRMTNFVNNTKFWAHTKNMQALYIIELWIRVPNEMVQHWSAWFWKFTWILSSMFFKVSLTCSHTEAVGQFWFKHSPHIYIMRKLRLGNVKYLRLR